jgi:hypothetical protein
MLEHWIAIACKSGLLFYPVQPGCHLTLFAPLTVEQLINVLTKGWKVQKHYFGYTEICVIFNSTNGKLADFLFYPISAERHFFGYIFLKLAGNTYNGKNGIPLFCFIFKRNTNEDIHI